MNLNNLTTKRLILRAPNENDIYAVFRFHSNPETNRYNPSGTDKSIEESRKGLQRWIQHWNKYNFGYWAVSKIEKSENVIGFGRIMFKEIENEKMLNLYFRFNSSAWGKGYANEMANKAIETGFNVLDQNKIAATVRPNNLPSTKALEKLGLKLHHKIFDEKGERLFYILNNPHKNVAHN